MLVLKHDRDVLEVSRAMAASSVTSAPRQSLSRSS